MGHGRGEMLALVPANGIWGTVCGGTRFACVLVASATVVQLVLYIYIYIYSIAAGLGGSSFLATVADLSDRLSACSVYCVYMCCMFVLVVSNILIYTSLFIHAHTYTFEHVVTLRVCGNGYLPLWW